MLAGEPPADLSLSPAPLDRQPPIVPIGLPSQLLERRPDVAASERRVAEANEQIGIARAAFFPTLMLGASAGLEGTSILNWFNWPSRFWAAGPSMVQTLFDAGRRRARSDAVLASYDASVANYRETALTAFQQVEDNLAALRILEQDSKEQREAVAVAQESLRIFTNRYKGGLDTYLQVITAQTATLTNHPATADGRERAAHQGAWRGMGHKQPAQISTRLRPGPTSCIPAHDRPSLEKATGGS